MRKLLLMLLGICVVALLLGGCGKKKDPLDKENEAPKLPEKEGYVLDWHEVGYREMASRVPSAQYPYR